MKQGLSQGDELVWFPDKNKVVLNPLEFGKKPENVSRARVLSVRGSNPYVNPRYYSYYRPKDQTPDPTLFCLFCLKMHKPKQFFCDDAKHSSCCWCGKTHGHSSGEQREERRKFFSIFFPEDACYERKQYIAGEVKI